MLRHGAACVSNTRLFPGVEKRGRAGEGVCGREGGGEVQQIRVGWEGEGKDQEELGMTHETTQAGF